MREQDTAKRRVPTRDECLDNAAAIYAGILDDPVRGPQIRAAREAADARRAEAAAKCNDD